jgi:hypothetical protein
MSAKPRGSSAGTWVPPPIGLTMSSRRPTASNPVDEAAKARAHARVSPADAVVDDADHHVVGRE